MGEFEKELALLENEKEKWKSRSSMHDNRDQSDYSRRVLIDKEIRELTARFISERNHLENENR